jgi:hypothetical protein
MSRLARSGRAPAVLAILSASIAAAASAQSATSARAGGLAFEPNLGRWPDSVRYFARAPGVAAWLEDGGMTLALLSSSESDGSADRGAALRWRWGGNGISGEAREERRIVRIAGRDAKDRRSSDHVWRRARWSGIAEGCDLVLREGRDGFEYDLELAPGARVEDVRIRCEGHEGLWIASDGSLVIATVAGELVQPPPVSWQVRAGAPEMREPLECRYRRIDGDTFGFELARRDPGLAAVIDPALRWSTYLSGDSEQSVVDIAPGPGGVTYVAGHTLSIGFPVTPGAYSPSWFGLSDGFVSCLSSDGSALVWSTFLGGTLDDRVLALAVDASGAVVVAGDTDSSDFPATAGAFDTSYGGGRDLFVTRIAANGATLDWSTFVGGTLAERFGDLALGSGGEPVLVGATRGSGFATTPGAYDTSHNGGAFFGDAFALRLRADGSALAWSTYLGSGGEELAERVAVGPADAVTLSGTTYSSAFPVTAGAYDTTWSAPSDAFVSRLSPDGAQLTWSTFLGGASVESVRALAVRPSGEVVAVGTVDGPGFPLSASAFDASFDGPSEGFACELSSDGAQLPSSTFLGGLDEDVAVAVALDSLGNPVVGGDTLSADFPTTPGAYDRNSNNLGGGQEFDVFVARLGPGLSAPDYSTYFGGPNTDHLGSLGIDAAGAVLLCGTTVGSGFPTSPNAFQPSYDITATTQGFVSRLELLLHPIPYGTPKVNSSGGPATARWEGFPSITDANFRVGVDLAIPNVWCYSFRGLLSANLPFVGGKLFVKPPLVRYPRFKSDFLGYGSRAIPLEAWMAGQTLYFQVYYDDPGDPHGASLTDALQVLVYP